MSEEIMMNRSKLEKLRTAYLEALDKTVEIFTFEGHELVPGYAKYLIQYLETKLAPEAR